MRKLVKSVLPDPVKRILLKYRAEYSVKPKPNQEYRYCGYLLPYQASVATIRTIESGKYWEEKLTLAMIQALSKLDTPAPLVLDIGANVGLVTLGIVAASNSVQVRAFEPAPFQRTLFQKTIDANELQDRVKLFDLAFGAKKGQAPFAAHFGIDASGLDGFVDTGAAGLSYQITVQVDTLDNWWASNGSPRVDLIKLDTEGSELLILSSASQLLQTCKPILFIEISARWLEHYSFSTNEVFVWLRDHGYALYSLEGNELTAATLAGILAKSASDNFMGQPLVG